VVFMGLAHLAEIAARLIAAGKDAHTPAAVVSRGTHADGESVTGELGEIAALAAGLESPALLVVGDVVAVSDSLTGARRHEPAHAV
jgi:siroheme synthase